MNDRCGSTNASTKADSVIEGSVNEVLAHKAGNSTNLGLRRRSLPGDDNLLVN